MIMPVKYNPPTVAKALAERNSGVKWSVLQATYGTGIKSAVEREMARLRKQRSRAATEQRVELPLPPGTAAALTRICEAAGDEPVSLLSTVTHRLDQIRLDDPATFEYLTRPLKTDISGVVARRAHLIGADCDE